MCVAWSIQLTWPSQALAEVSADSQIAAARSLGLEGLAAYERDDLTTAADRFERAFRLYPVPTLALWSGRVLARTGKLVEASERWLKATRLAVEGNEEGQLVAQREAAAERRALLPRIPTVQFVLVDALPDGAVFSIDSKELSTAVLGSPLPINPGSHEVVIQWPDRSASAKIELSEGEQRRVELRPGPATASDVPPKLPGGARQPPPPADTRRTHTEGMNLTGSGNRSGTWGWVAVGIGAAGMATWGVSGLLALNKRSTLDDHCVNDNCPPPYHDTLSSYRTLRTVSGVAFAVGAIGIGTGAVLLMAAPDGKAKASRRRWHGWIGLTGAGVSGEY